MRSIKLGSLVLFLSLTWFSVNSQNSTFSGRILAEDTGEPLVGAHVKIKSDISQGTAADIEGKFTLIVDPGTHTFVFTFTGMQKDSLTLSFTPGQVIEKDILLTPYVSTLEGIEVKVGKFDRKIEEITVSMEVLKPDLIENKNTTNIKTILDYTPGLNILDNEPQIRGGSGFTFGVGSKVGILVDGMPMLSPDAGRPFWDFIPVENIEQIEVVKGCASVLSGANALSGAIYIRTKSPGLTPNTKIKVYSGLYSSPKYNYMKWWNDVPYIGGADFLHTRVENNLDIVIGANVHFDHGYIGAPKPGPFVVDTVSNFSDDEVSTERYRFNFRLRKRSEKIEGLNFGINGNYMHHKTNMVLAWLDDSAGFYRGYPGAMALQNKNMFYLDPFLNFYSKIGIRHSLKARVLHNAVSATNNQGNRSTLYFADYNFKREYDFLKGFAFVGGLSFQYNDVQSRLYSGSGTERNKMYNLSGYAELENNIFDIINFSIGARLEYFSLNDSVTDLKPIFRAGASIKVLQETYVRLSIGQGYRFPTIAERYIRTNLGSFAVFDNPDLQPEHSWNAEVGVKQGFKFANFFGYLDIAVFQQEYRNTIEYLFGFWDSTYNFALAGFRFLNTGKSRITGIDISLNTIGKVGEKGDIKVLFGYNYILPKTLEPDYVFAKDYNPGGSSEFSYETTSVDPGKNILKYRFLHTIKGDVEFNYDRFSTGISAKYFSRIENLDKAIADFEKATGSTGGTLQPIKYMDYFYNHNNGNLILDFRISYLFAGKHKVSIISNNLLNRWYSLRPLKAEPMRTIMLQYRVEF